MVGNPDDFKKRLQTYQKYGITHIICAMGAGVTDTEIVQESMSLMKEKVIPEFA